jgi:20S proteasome subunit beta 6
VIGSPGFLADAVTLQKHLHARQVMYQHNHGRKMSCPAMAQARYGQQAPALLHSAR